MFTCDAGARELDLQADKITYLEDGARVVAEGNVVAQFENIRIHAELLSYRSATGDLEVERGFVLEDPPYRIAGVRLHYNVLKRTGEAWGVSTDFKNTHFAGDHLLLYPDFLAFRNAEYSSCGGMDPPKYKVTARAIDLDLNDGLVIARWGFFWLGPWPIFPVPAFVHTLGGVLDIGRRRNTSPFPTLGSNDEDGIYGYWSNRLQGIGPGRALLYLGYSAKKKITGEVQYTLQPFERMSWEGRVGGSHVDGLWGGVDVTLNAAGARKKRKEDIPALFSWEGFQEPISQAYLRLSFTHRERINFQRVSFRPLGEFQVRSVDWLLAGTQFDLGAHGGRVIEEGSGLDLLTVKFAPDLQYHFMTPFGKPSVRLAYDWRLYNTGTSWSQGWAGLLWELPPLPLLQTHLKYSLPFHLRGGSPFLHEVYRFFGVPYYGVRFRLGGAPWFTELEGDYNLPENSPKERNITLGYAVECMEISLKWLSEQKLFQFGLNLVSQ